MNGKVTVDQLAQVIRTVDGGHSLGAAALAEAILEALPHLQPAKPEAVRLRDELRERADEDQLVDELRDVEDYFNDVDPNPIHLATVQAAISALAATGKQQVGEEVTDEMVEAALQSTVAEPNVWTPWREVVALDDHADFIADMRKAIQAAISVQPGTPDFSPATQAVADHCDRIFWRHNYYTLPLGPSDRAKPTPRRQSAVELVQKLGFQWRNEAWVQIGEVQAKEVQPVAHSDSQWIK